MKTIDLPPFAPVLIESTRAIGYSLEAAISDVLDNSISAQASQINVHYTPYGKPHIAIFDNGCGMDADKLTESMRYGSGDPNGIRETHDMGRYGLGMKTASLSQCRCLTVASKKDNIISARRWDLDYIRETGQWSLAVLEGDDLLAIPLISELEQISSGTIVVWENLDRIFSGEITLDEAMTDKMDSVRKHISLIFHRFLPGGDVKPSVSIAMNGEPVQGFDPFFTAKSREAMEEERIEIPQFNSVVTVQPYILPHPSKMTKSELELYGGRDGFRSQQGFYIYRNKRLLIWGTWFRMTKMDEFSKLARVRIDIPNTLDDLWTLDVKKSTATPPEIVRVRLKQIISNIVGDSKRTYTYRGRRETRDDVAHVWSVYDTREGIRYELNCDHPLYEKLTEIIDDDARKLLDEYIQTVASRFPINRLHSDIFNEKKMAEENISVVFDSIKTQLSIYMQMAETLEERKEILHKLLQAEPFCDYKDKILKLYDMGDL